MLEGKQDLMVLMTSYSLPFLSTPSPVRGLGVPSLKACMSKPLPDWRRAPRGKSPRKPKSTQISTTPHAQTPYRFFTWPSPLFSARPLTSSTLCALQLSTRLQCNYVIMTHESAANAVAETEATTAAAHPNVNQAASEGMAAAAQRC